MRKEPRINSIKVHKFYPRKTNIVVLVYDQVHKTKAGLFLPETRHKDKFRQGVVTAVGPECKDCKPGEQVIFNEYTGTKVQYTDLEEKDRERVYLFMKEADIWASYAGKVFILEVHDTDG